MKLPNLKKPWMLLATFWLVSSIGLLIWSLSGSTFKPGLWAQLYWCAVIIFSHISFAAFGWDKWKAGRDSLRIPEKTLHILGALGGWPGSVLGQQLFRHKTIKPVFRSILMLTVAVHLAGGLYFVFRRFADGN